MGVCARVCAHLCACLCTSACMCMKGMEKCGGATHRLGALCLDCSSIPPVVEVNRNGCH